MSQIRLCTKCGKEKEITEFGWKNRFRGYRHWVCKECTAVSSSNWYYENQDRQKKMSAGITKSIESKLEPTF
jgi:hypothetical protein